MRKKREILIAVLALVVVGLIASPALAKRQYRSSLAGPTRWVSVSEPAYEGRDQSTQPVTTVVQENDAGNAIEGTAEFLGETVDATGVMVGETAVFLGETAGGAIEGTGTFVGDTAETVGVAFGDTVEATGQAGGGILTWVGDAAGAIGGFIGETFEFIFGGWGRTMES